MIETLTMFLSVSFNSLTGELPVEIGDLPDVEGLFFIGNNLSGQIPSEYAQPPALTALRLEGNEFTGVMPDEICALVGPFLRLEELGADCEDPNFEVSVQSKKMYSTSYNTILFWMTKKLIRFVLSFSVIVVLVVQLLNVL